MIMQRASALLGLVLLPVVALAEPASFHVAADEETTEVRFHSKATLESFEGTTHELSGSVELDPTNLTFLRAELVCQLASIDTGIGLRNKHMRNNVLHTDDYPTAKFVLAECSGGALVTGEPAKFSVKGEMTLHGVTRPLDASVVATLVSNDLVEFSASFVIKLSDYGIKRPKMLMMKVAEEVTLTVSAQARRGTKPAES